MTDDTMTAALAPVRAALLAAARRDAADVRARSAAAAAATLAAAGAEAERIRGQAREEGAADAAAGLAAERARARREAHARILAARSEAYEDLCAAARRAVGALRDEPGYPELRRHLAEAARRLLGPDAALHEGTGGGVIGQGAGRRLDYALVRFADRAVAAVAAEADEEES